MKNLYLLLLLLTGATQCLHAQPASQYFFKAKTGVVLEDISAGASPLIGQGADGVQSGEAAFFPFSFAGVTYNSFSVSEDGVVVLGSGKYYPYPYDDYFAQSYGFPPVIPAPVYPLLLPWGEDLYTANGGISYKITGAAPSRKLVIQFQANSAEDGAETYNKTFQVWLFEGSNTIQYVYGEVAADWYNSANIGMAASATDFLSVNGSTNSASATEVASNSGNYPDKATVPVSGMSYIFSPSAINDQPPPPPPAASMTAVVSVWPEYTVPGQQKQTIYFGYGLPAVLLSAKATGGTPGKGYRYAWSPAAGLSSTSCALPLASPTVTTTYTVTVTDGQGGSATATVTVYVVDARCGNKNDKLKVCKTENGRSKELCIAISAVAEHLLKGETLGGCSVAPTGATAITAGRQVMEENAPQAEATVYPVPSNGAFTVQLPATTQATSITVYDANGRIVTAKVVGASQSRVSFDLTGQPRGVYLLKVNGKERTQLSKIILQ